MIKDNKSRYITIDMLRGCINRICVTDDETEVYKLCVYAQKYLFDLADYRIKKLELGKNELKKAVVK